MTSAELIQNFQEKNRIQLNGNEMRMAIDRILTVNTNNKERESLIREYIVSVYPQIADEFERNRVRTSVENIRSAPKTTAVDFFEEYVNIVSQIVKESSDQFTAEAIENAEKVNKNLEEAEYKHENAVSKYEDAQMFQTSGTNINMSKYRTELDDAQAALSIAKQKKESLTPFTPYESSMDYFGISGLDALKMLNEQLNAYNYMDMRRSQIETQGVTSSAYITDLYSDFPQNVKYQNASADDKRKMQQVYVTKQIMQEKLDSHKGVSGWLWKLVHRSETKAMNNYIASASSALFNAGFDEAAAAEAIDAMSERGYFSGEYTAFTLDTVNEKFAENEKIYAPLRDRKTEAKLFSEIPLKDQFFEIKFRPSTKTETYNKQLKAFKEVKAFVDGGNNIPDDVKKVYEASKKKMASVMKLHNQSQLLGPQQLNNRDSVCEKIEAELMNQVSLDNYKPMSFDELMAMNGQKEHVKVDLNDENVNKELSQPVNEDLVKKNDDKVLGN